MSILRAIFQAPACATLITDVSGNLGCGTYVNTSWFQLHWTGHLTNAHTSVKELVPIVIAVALWGHKWVGKTILVWLDNTVAINSHTSQHEDTVHMLRCLTFLLAKWQCHLITEHLSGSHNAIADALSRNNLSHFQTLFPQAVPEPPQQRLTLGPDILHQIRQACILQSSQLTN